MTLITISSPTSSRAAFQAAIQASIIGDPSEADAYIRSISAPDFYLVLNGKRLSLDAYVAHIKEMRESVGEYAIKAHEFMRTGDMLAARMTGRMKLKGGGETGHHIDFEAMIIAGVAEDGRISWMKERSGWEESLDGLLDLSGWSDN